MFLLAALSLGFLGSFHCIGMCGPIALAVPVKRTSRFSVFFGALTYNTGRVVTYAAMGLLFGLLGKGFQLAGWQSTLSVLLGITILLIVFVPKANVLNSGSHLLYKPVEKLKSGIRKLFGTHSYQGLFLIGLLNGLLPCGLVYLGVAGSVATGDAINGSLFMAAFGLGTLPAMLALVIIKDYISIGFREKIRKTIPVFATAMAVLLILRGLNLGIPYISPSIENRNDVIVHKCCHK